MKRKAICVMSVALCLGLTACGGKSTESDKTSSTASEETSTKKGGSETTITQEDLKSYLEEVTITPDNWEDYFSVEDYSYVSEDNIDGKIGETVNAKILTAKDNVVASDDLTLEFTYTSTCTEAKYFDMNTGEYITDSTDSAQYYVGQASEETAYMSGRGIKVGNVYLYRDKVVNGSIYSVDNQDAFLEKTCEVSDFKLSSASGTVNIVKIPDDKWNTDKDHGRYLVLDDDGLTYYLFESGESSWNSMDSIDWDEESDENNFNKGCANWSWDMLLN